MASTLSDYANERAGMIESCSKNIFKWKMSSSGHKTKHNGRDLRRIKHTILLSQLERIPESPNMNGAHYSWSEEVPRYLGDASSTLLSTSCIVSESNAPEIGPPMGCWIWLRFLCECFHHFVKRSIRMRRSSRAARDGSFFRILKEECGGWGRGTNNGIVYQIWCWLPKSARKSLSLSTFTNGSRKNALDQLTPSMKSHKSQLSVWLGTWENAVCGSVGAWPHQVMVSRCIVYFECGY